MNQLNRCTVMDEKVRLPRLAVVLLLALAACSPARVKVTGQAPATFPRYTRLAVPPFTNAAFGVPQKTSERAAAAVMVKVASGAFSEVASASSGEPGELLVRGEIRKYDIRRSKHARSLDALSFSSPSDSLELSIALIDAATGKRLEEFSVESLNVLAPAAGGSLGPEGIEAILINSAAAKIAERIAPYGRGG